MTEKKLTHFKRHTLMYEGQHTIKYKSDKAVTEGALSDPDAQPQTQEQLAQFKRVNPLAKKDK